MTDRAKIIIFSLSFPLAISLAGYFSFLYISEPSYISLQNSVAEKNIITAKAIINERVVALAKITEDWGQWTELYNSVGENNSLFISESLGLSQMDNLNIDIAAVISKNNEVVFGTNRGATGAEVADIPTGLLKKIVSLSTSPKTASGIFVEEGQNPIIFAVSPILKTDTTGPEGGKLFFGKSIDSKFLNKISELVLNSVTVVNESNLKEIGQYSDAVEALKSSNFYVQNRQKGITIAYLNLPTTDSENLIIKINFNSEVLAQKDRININLLYVFSLAGLLSGIMVYILVYGLVLNRIRVLLDELQKETPNFSSIKTAPGDKLGLIIKKIEDVLEKATKNTNSGKYLFTVLNATTDAIIITSISGDIQSWNKGAENLLGYNSEFAIGKNILFMVLPERRDIATAIIKDRLLKGDGVLNYNGILIASGGNKVNVSISASVIKDDSGSPSAIVNIIREAVIDKKVGEDGEKT